MSTTISQYRAIETVAGVEPVTDKTSFSTQHYVASDKIRFVNGFPRKIKGWASIDFNNSATISGAPRSIYSAVISGQIYTNLL